MPVPPAGSVARVWAPEAEQGEETLLKRSRFGSSRHLSATPSGPICSTRTTASGRTRFARFLAGIRKGPVLAAAALTAVSLPLAFPSAPAGASDAGAVFALGDAPFHGAPGNARVTGMAGTASGNGYWLAASDGAVYAYGDAAFHGSAANVRLSAPIVDIARTPTGDGYWLVAEDGGIFSFGDASYHGSTGAIRLAKPIVGMAATASGGGYWLVAADGGIFTFGDASFLGSTGGLRLAKPVVGMASTPTGDGYWLVASDGGIFTFGDAPFHGSTGAMRLVQPIVGMASSPTGQGYWLVASDGGIFTYGDAEFRGSVAGRSRTPVVGIDSTPSGDGQWLATGGRLIGQFEVTCYALRGSTASGLPVSEERIAVDPRVIPLGRRVYVGGLGLKTAADTGGNIKGNRIDIWKPSSAACTEFGRQVLPVFELP